MNCPRCHTPLENTYRCPRCHYEDPTMRRILFAANYHYNQGLYKARVRDLSGAAASLRMSLKYNKRQTNARNLLGLVYYQMGEIVDALSEWVISVHFQSQGNVARNYIRKVQNNPGRLQVINETIQKYNLALRYLEEGSQDLAVIELKKVVNLNPNLIRAYQLLGLLYMRHKQYAAARKVLSRALKMDRNNITTVRYMNELAEITGQKGRRRRPVEGQKTVQIKDPNPIVIERSKGGYSDFNTGTLSFVNILIGLIIGAAVVGLLLVPSMRRMNRMEYNQAVTEYSSQISDRNEQITRLQSQVDALTQENDQLKNSGGDAVSAQTRSAADEALLQAVKAYMANDYSTAGLTAADIDASALTDENSRDIYDYLVNRTKDVVADTLFADAQTYYEDKDYMNAAASYKRYLVFVPDSDEALYYLGRTYQNLTDFENARTCYEQVIDMEGGSEYADEARRYLDQIEETLSGAGTETQDTSADT